MNWLDIVLIGIVVFGALRGMRVGLFGAVVTAVALFFGWLIASQISHVVSNLLPVEGLIRTVVIVACFAVVMGLMVAGFQLAWKVARPLIGLATFGLSSLVDRIGGVAFGLVVGLMLSGVIILILARVTYDLPQLSQVPSALFDSVETRLGLEDTLTESASAPIFIRIVNVLPESALGLIQADFAKSLDILESRLK